MTCGIILSGSEFGWVGAIQARRREHYCHAIGRPRSTSGYRGNGRMEVWDVQQQFKDLPANRPVRNPRKHTKMVLTLHINTNWEHLIQQLCIDVRCVWYDNLCYFFLFTNNAYVLEQKANDFYPRNDTYLPLVGDVIVVKENSIFVVVVSCCLLCVACMLSYYTI